VCACVCVCVCVRVCVCVCVCVRVCVAVYEDLKMHNNHEFTKSNGEGIHPINDE
jgi:hypothetical protein